MNSIHYNYGVDTLEVYWARITDRVEDIRNLLLSIHRIKLDRGKSASKVYIDILETCTQERVLEIWGRGCNIRTYPPEGYAIDFDNLVLIEN